MPPSRSPRRRTLIVLLSALGVAGAMAGVPLIGQSGPEPRKPPKTGTTGGVKPKGTPTTGPAAGVEPSWKGVDQLVSEQKMEAASQLAATLREKARAAGNEAEWTKGLIREVQLRIALHGYETAVRFLKDEPWPAGALHRATLNLFYGHALVTYQQAYSWEIGKRERVETKGAVDLKAWTREEIFQEAQKAYLSVWRLRSDLGGQAVSVLSEYVSPNSYPREIRGTLRDAVSYLFVELLGDTASWRPEQSNETYALPLAKLLQGGEAGPVGLDDPSVHPLRRIGAILDDLEAWHAKEGRREAALEARLTRIQQLNGSFTEAEDRDTIRRHLESILPGYRDVPWWSMGMGRLAELQQGEARPGNLVRAHATAEKGRAAYPGSAGGQLCLSIVKSLEAPEYQIQTMSSDAAGKRSLQVTHKNLPRVFFRAYLIDLDERLRTSKDYNLLPQGRELKDLLTTGKRAAEWSVELPRTPDYKSHLTFVTPPMRRPGAYTVVASAKADFSSADNRILGVHTLVTDLVLLVRQAGGGQEVRAVSGSTGSPVPDARITLWRFDWNKGHHEVETKTPGPDGLVYFPPTGANQGGNHFLLARSGKSGEDLAFDPSYMGFWQPPPPSEVTASLVYTDRSIYRPGQKVFWKVVAYRGLPQEGRYKTLAEASLSVSLLDANGQRVEDVQAKTNAFGSAWGEFVVPPGRALGAWRITSSLSGGAAIRVEEYKRPTFEAALKEPKETLRLNRAATLHGEVKYYFGLPVVNGSVRWRVTREPVYPWWWGWWWSPPATTAQVVATGKSSLDEKGTFQLTFTPRADERKSRQVTYRYVCSADVTDEGGETRSATRSFRLGFVAVEASLTPENGFFREGQPAKVILRRTDLDGTPRAGAGTYRLLRVRQPADAILPADLPKARPPKGVEGDADEEAGDIKTPGDGLRPRWDVSYTWDRVLATWEDGDEVGRGTAAHDDKGQATAAFEKLPPGAYRLRYETKDDFGATFTTSRDFVVAGRATALELPLVLLGETSSAKVGETARFLLVSGLPGQTLYVDVYRDGKPVDRRRVESGRPPSVLEFPISEKDRGGFGISVAAVRDHQLLQATQSVFVPWDDRELKVEFASFRDRMRPGGNETWKVTVSGPDGRAVEKGTAELLAYMYDRSLDVFAAHNPPGVKQLYPWKANAGSVRATLGAAASQWIESNFPGLPAGPHLVGDRLIFFDRYGIGGPGLRRGMAGGALGGVAMRQSAPAPASLALAESVDKKAVAKESEADAGGKRDEGRLRKDGPEEQKNEALATTGEAPAEKPVALRSDFSETAFWKPALVAGPDGSASIEFTVPDSVTSWNVWVHAVTTSLRGGSVKKETKSVKELMVRPYLPRFLREGDEAAIKVVVNNASEKDLSGRLTFDILDPESNQSILSEFALRGPASQAFTVKAGGGTNLVFPVTAPKSVRPVAFKVIATAGDLSDGELRPLPLLPSRVHLAQSRFVTLKGASRKVLRFEDLAKDDDPTRIHEQMVVTVDAQLFYTVLQSLPYLVNYPYECTEQTLNRFISTGIVSQLYRDYPPVARMAEKLSKRTTPLETWDGADPNRKMALEETPWVLPAKGGSDWGLGLTNVLDPRVAKADREASLAKLKKAQTAIGGFPWWPGGPPSPYMTLYILHGFAKAMEFGVDVPKDVVQRAWAYVGLHYEQELKRYLKDDCCWEFLTFLNYVASCYPDDSWTNGVLPDSERRAILDHSFRHWRRHSPYLKGYLTLTLKRMGREKDARLVWDSVMDSAKTNEDQGTFWAPEDRSWLWYNDTIETHAFALRTLMELSPKDARRDGLVQWILINKKLNQWKSTRATAEVVYSLLHYLKGEGALGIREDATVTVGNQRVQFVFEPDEYTGKKNQIVIPGEKVDPRTTSEVVVEKESKGFAFASATWHFSTDRMPEEDRGDFFQVSRTYFRREMSGREWVLKPLADGTTIQVGDQLEVQLSLRSKHAAEYVHLRDPRGAGFEPENQVSRYRWDLGIGCYEEIRDSGANFFFEQLPVGEYTFKYRVRASMAGTFRVGPATVQSMYAPEFNAYSSGAVLTIRPDGS